MSNPYEESARRLRVIKFTAALQAGEIDADAAERMWETEWAIVAKALGIKPPSETTVAEVIKALRFAESLKETK